MFAIAFIPTIATGLSLIILLIKGKWNQTHPDNSLKCLFLIVLAISVVYIVFAPTLYLILEIPDMFLIWFLWFYRLRLYLTIVLIISSIYAMTRSHRQYKSSGRKALALGVFALILIGVLNCFPVFVWLGGDATKITKKVRYLPPPAEFKFLMGAGIGVNTHDQEGNTLMHFAATQSAGMGALRTSILLGGDINSVNRWKETPLHHAVSRQHPWAINYLLKKGAQLDARDVMGRTPLSYAVSVERAPCIKVLSDHGARIGDFPVTLLYDEPNLQEELKANPSLASASDGWGLTPLHIAVVLNDVKATKLLLAHQAPVNTTDVNGYSPLRYATDRRGIWRYAPEGQHYLEIMKLLLIHGADANEVYKYDDSLLIKAIECDDEGAVALLLEHGADANMVGVHGDPPLYKALFGGRQAKSIVTLLLEHGADPLKNNSYGKTAMDLARDDYPYMLELLQKYVKGRQ
jgi:ankyrin repeat protein